ncbi:MAG TPA: MFS transporter [Rhizomicrobium sp.]|nr:MFS transporter [Rhizomicrobium sp.]
MPNAAESIKAPLPTRMGRVVTASAAGTVFEWYDFFIFGSLAAIIAKHYFASAGEVQGYIFALLTFAAGFFVRPFGAIVFGHIGDRTGRKRAFLVTITLMGLATFAVGFLPDYAAIGPLAPWLLVLLRVVQGFAVGGEYGGAAIYVAEHASREKRGQATGWIQISASLGLFLALAVILVTRMAIGEEAFVAWGWRIPFLLSVVLLAISLWIRLKLDESPVFRKMQEEGETSKAPLSEAFLQWPHLRLMIIVLFALLMGQGVVWYTAQFYTQFFLERVMRVEPATVNMLIMVITLISAPLHMAFAIISDRIGRKPVMLFGLGLAAVSIFPGFHLLTQAVNPALVSASITSPVIVNADPADCSLQFDLIGRAKFVTSCDIARSALTKMGVPYHTEKAPSGARAVVHVGSLPVTSLDGRKLSSAELAKQRGFFENALSDALRATGYPKTADPSGIDIAGALAALLIFVIAAAALYGPQAATLVELFPTRIRYTAMSVPYHIGVGWFGGFLPATAFAIVAATGNIYAGLWYPVIIAAVGFVVTLFFLPETKGRDISH